ncbi:MAG: hypothetical protein QOJ81_424 [Chloroflexota bacterium]|jgi:hypothetical protein|nr:hypothetical protein [Chloroflexota bacterium]
MTTRRSRKAAALAFGAMFAIGGLGMRGTITVQ